MCIHLPRHPNQYHEGSLQSVRQRDQDSCGPFVLLVCSRSDSTVGLREFYRTSVVSTASYTLTYTDTANVSLRAPVCGFSSTHLQYM